MNKHEKKEGENKKTTKDKKIQPKKKVQDLLDQLN
jgi:hypothetical protein